MEWKVGDVVQLKSGGPAMTVNIIELHPDDLSVVSIHCTWFTGTAVSEKAFAPDALQAYKEPEKRKRQYSPGF